MAIHTLILRASIYVVLMTLSSHAQSVFGTDSGSQQSGFLSSPSSSDDNILSDNASSNNTPRISPLSSKRSRRFQVTPYASASVTYSDNLGLVSDNSPDKESGLIYNAAVGVNASYQSKRLDAVAGVNLSQIWRDNGTDNTLPSANAGVSAEVIRNLLFLDALGSIQGLRGNGLDTNSSSGASNFDYEAYITASISPYIRYNFGNLAVGELRYGYDYGGGSADSIGEVQSNTYSASLGTANLSNRLNVDTSVSYTDIEYEDQLGANEDSQQYTAEVTARYALTPRLTAVGQVGYDEVRLNDQEFADQLSEVFYNAGLEYMPSQRLRLTARYGQRNDTEYYLLDGNYNLTKRAFIGVTGISQLLTAIPVGFRGNITPGTAFDEVIEGETLASSLNDTVVGGGTVANDGLTPFGSVQNRELFISQSINAYLGINMGNGELGVAIGYEDRDFNTAVDEKVRTATAQYRYNIARDVTGTIEAFYFGLDGLPQNTQDTYGIRLLADYALNDQVSLFASVGRTQRSAELADADFTEHSITAGITSQF